MIVVDGDFEAERRGEQGNRQLAGAVVVGVGAPVEPARRDSMYEQVLVEEIVAVVHETAADGSLAAIPPGTMR
jgi:hypothetical protein